MARYTTSVASSLSPAAAFAYMAAFENAQQWDPGVATATRVDSGPVTLGTRFRLETVTAGRRLPLVYEVTAFDADRSFTVTAESASLRSVDTVRVEPAGDGSLVTYDAVLGFRGALVLASPLLPLVFRRIGDRAAAGLMVALNPHG